MWVCIYGRGVGPLKPRGVELKDEPSVELFILARSDKNLAGGSYLNVVSRAQKACMHAQTAMVCSRNLVLPSSSGPNMLGACGCDDQLE